MFVKRVAYDEMLRELLIKLSPYSDKIEVVIKSHPKNDNHPLYDQLKSEFPDLLIRNWREPIVLTEPLPADVVVYNSNSTLTFAAFEQELPVLGFWGALTPLALDNIVINQLHGTNDVSQLVRFSTLPNRTTEKRHEKPAEKPNKCITDMSNRHNSIWRKPSNLHLIKVTEIDRIRVILKLPIMIF